MFSMNIRILNFILIKGMYSNFYVNQKYVNLTNELLKVYACALSKQVK